MFVSCTSPNNENVVCVGIRYAGVVFAGGMMRVPRLQTLCEQAFDSIKVSILLSLCSVLLLLLLFVVALLLPCCTEIVAFVPTDGRFRSAQIDSS